MMRRTAPALSLLLLASCSGSPSSGSNAAASASPSAALAPAASSPYIPLPEPGISPPASAALPLDEGLWRPLAALEAVRTSIKAPGDEPALIAHEPILRAHFGGAIPSPLELQTTPLVGARRAVLVAGPAGQRNPLVVVLDAQSKILWTKERPLAGTRQKVDEIVVAPGPRGEVILLWYDTPTGVLAARKWGAMGEVLADFEVGEVSTSEALSGLYWPGQGWLVVAAQLGAARAQLLGESGQRAFGPGGVDLPWASRASAPVAIAADSDASVILIQVGDARRGATGVVPDHLLAQRYDSRGVALWQAPVDLGPAPAGSGAERIVAERVEPGVVRVALGKLVTGVTSAGTIAPVGKLGGPTR